MPTCIIKGCKNRPECVRNTDKGITFHRFPIHKPDLMKKWLRSIGVSGLKDKVKMIHNTSVICSVHFEASCLKTVNMRRRLLPDAVPTIFSTSEQFNNPNTQWTVTKEGDEEVIKEIKAVGDDKSKSTVIIGISTPISNVNKKADKEDTSPVEDDDDISLVCLSPTALSQQVVFVPALQSLPEELSIMPPPVENTRKRKLKIPSLCLESLRDDNQERSLSKTLAYDTNNPDETASSSELQKVIIVKASSKLHKGKKKRKKFPTKIPAQVIKGKKKEIKSSLAAMAMHNNVLLDRPMQDVVCVADVFAQEPVIDGISSAQNQNMTGLCRVCAAGHPIMISIFGKKGKEQKLLEKIHRFLPIQISEEDRLPLEVCTMCVERLNSCEELAECCQEADLRLRLLLDAEDMQFEVEELVVPKSRPKEDRGVSDDEENIKPTSSLITCVDCGKHFPKFRPYARHCYTIHRRKKCKNCDQFFVTKEELLKHKLKIHGIKCDCCDESFVSINAHLNHLRKEHPNFKSYTCELCGKSFNSKYGLAIHTECHQIDRPFLCDTCGKNFKSKRKLKVHKCVSNLNEALPDDNTCKICGKVYTLRSSLTRHLIRHKGERRFECNICEKKFFGSVNLKNHMVIHEKATIYECSLCCARYFHKRNMISHIKYKHSVLWNYKCPSCDQIFQTIEDVILHRKIHDDENIALGISQVSDITPGSCLEFQCKICEKYFENIYVLTYHFEDHVIRTEEDLHIKSVGDDGTFECNYCGEKMVSNWTMKRHIKKFHNDFSNTSELLYECEFCAKRFATKQQLRQHVYQHTGEKPHRCQYCDAGFRTQLALKVHSRIHTGETPYCCLKCPKKFRSSATLRIHQGIHDKPFCCPHCGQRFPKKLAYKKHIMLHNSEGLVHSSDSKTQSKKGTVYKCKHCDYISKTRSSVKKHESTHQVESTYLNL